MVLPIAKEAFQQVGTAQERAVDWAGATEDNMVAAAGANVSSIHEEFFRPEIAMACFLVERLGVVDEFGPVRRRMKIDFDDARIWCDLEMLESMIVGWRVALDLHRNGKLGGGVLHGGNQVEVIFRESGGWHEDVEKAV